MPAPPPLPPPASPTGGCDFHEALPPTSIPKRLSIASRERVLPVALRGGFAGVPASLPKDELLEEFGDELWQPQLLLPGNATRLRPYLERAAAGKVKRPIAFNRPSSLAVAKEAFARVARAGWPPVLSHTRIRSGSSLEGGAGLDLFVGPNGSGLPLHHHGAIWNGLQMGPQAVGATPAVTGGVCAAGSASSRLGVAERVAQAGGRRRREG